MGRVWFTRKAHGNFEEERRTYLKLIADFSLLYNPRMVAFKYKSNSFSKSETSLDDLVSKNGSRGLY